MRKYSEPPYDLNEMTAVFRGICKAIGEDDKYKKRHPVFSHLLEILIIYV